MRQFVTLVASAASFLLTPARTNGAETMVPPFDALYSLTVVGQPPVPAELNGLGIRPNAPNRLLIASKAQSPEAAVWSVGLVRDSLGHIVGLSEEPPVLEFSVGGLGSSLYASLVVLPNGVILFPGAGSDQIGQIFPGHTVPDLLIPVLPLGLGKYPSALFVHPPGWCFEGKMVVFSAWVHSGGQSMAIVDLIPTATGHWLIGCAENSVVNGISVTGVAAVPDNCVTGTFGHLIAVCENFEDRISFVPPDNNGLPNPVDFMTVVEGIDGPRGMTTDPVTGDLVFLDRDPSLRPLADRVRTLRFIGECGCPADLDQSGRVSGPDLAILLGAWGADCVDAGTDLNFDAIVDATDLAILLGAWGSCPD